MMDAIDDDTHRPSVVVLTDAGDGLMKVWINQTGHCQKKLAF
jgi:hypothetical protein